MNRASRLTAVLLLIAAFAGCDANHTVVYSPENVSGRWHGAGAYRNGGTYDAALLLRQAGRDVYADGTIRFTDATGNVTDVPYDVRATYEGRTLTFQTGYGVATVSEDGRTMRWLYGDGTGAYDLERR